jgi:hypothetical protein
VETRGGHDFSRAEKRPKNKGVLTPEVRSGTLHGVCETAKAAPPALRQKQNRRQ